MRSLGPTVTLLRAIVGMIPPGARALNPAVNAIQSLVLVTDPQSSRQRIALMQNTLAAFMADLTSSPE